ncbi:MAG: hypothetical protein ABSC77_04270 [Terracidiphilus sp.]
MPDSIIFALGVLSGTFTVLIIWAYIEKRREDESWPERSYSIDKDISSRWSFNFVWGKNAPNSVQDDGFNPIGADQ